MVSRKNIVERKDRAITVVGALLLIAGGWAVFSLTRYGFTNLLLRFGVESEVYQNVAIIVFVILFFVIVAGSKSKNAVNKLLRL